MTKRIQATNSFNADEVEALADVMLFVEMRGRKFLDKKTVAQLEKIERKVGAMKARVATLKAERVPKAEAAE